MDIILEIGKHDICIGAVSELDPIVIPISYAPSGSESKYLADHALTPDQYDTIITHLDDTHKQELQQYNASLGTWLDIESTPAAVLHQLLYDAMEALPVSAQRCFVVDYGFSQRLKRSVCGTLFKNRVKAVVFVPAPVLLAIGSNRRDALVVNEEWGAIHKVIDLRVIGEYDIEESIDEIIRKSDIDIRKVLRENIVNAKDTVGCWTACSLYVSAATTHANWEEITKDYVFQ